MFDFILRRIYGFDSSVKKASVLLTETQHKPVFITIESHLCPYSHRFQQVKKEIHSFIKKTELS